MPAKDRANLIKEPIESVINQTFNDWELIVVDDHSSDNLATVVQNFAKLDIRIRYLTLIDGTGPGAARDFGIRRARGSYIAIADSDDINMPYRLEKSLLTLSNECAAVVYGNLEVDNSESGEKFIRPSHPYSVELLKKINYIPNPTATFEKSAYIAVGGYNKSLRTSEDYDLWLKLTEAGAKFSYIDEVLVRMKVHETNTTKTVVYDERKSNLKKVRAAHNLVVPTYESTMSLVENDIKKIFSTDHQKQFWFAD